MPKKEPTPGLILKHQDKMRLPGTTLDRVLPEELDPIAKRADAADIPRLVQEIRTLRSFVEMATDALLHWENGGRPPSASLRSPPSGHDA